MIVQQIHVRLLEVRSTIMYVTIYQMIYLVALVVKVMQIVFLEECNSVAKKKYVKYVLVNFVKMIVIVQMEVVVAMGYVVT
tara:strand:- start:155 stop:397 length:243 start_codon:yes stop_codon:yes gene_type:complete